MSQTPFEAYVMFCAIRAHMTTDHYDYFKYQGKIRASKKSFDQRNDKYRYEKLARMPDNELRVAATFLAGGTWIGDVTSTKGEQAVLPRLRYIQSCSRSFSEDLSNILHRSDKLSDALYPANNQTPPLISLLKQDKVQLETMCILDDFFKISKGWALQYPLDPLIKKQVVTIGNYKGFFQYNKARINKILVDRL